MRAEDKLELTPDDERGECVSCGISTEQRDRVMTVADEAINLLREAVPHIHCEQTCPIIRDTGDCNCGTDEYWNRLHRFLDGQKP